MRFIAALFLLQIAGRVYTLGWKDQETPAKGADIVLIGVYLYAAYIVWHAGCV